MSRALCIIFSVVTLFGCNYWVGEKTEGSVKEQINHCARFYDCDSIYYHENDLFICVRELNDFDIVNNLNYVFEAIFQLSDSCIIVYSDSVYSKTGELKFEDYNKDGISDILIQCNSDVRSNWTWNLYLVDHRNISITKIHKFSSIKNPQFDSYNGLIESYVISGKNYFQYFKITGDYSICRFDTTVYDNIDSSEPGDWETLHDSIMRKVELRECLNDGW